MTKWQPPEGRCRCGRPIAILERWCRSCAADEADRLVGRFVKRRDGGCVVCGSHHWIEWAHVHRRQHTRLRWEPENAVTLCKDHHTYFTNNPRAWRDFIEEYAPGLWEELLERERTLPRPDIGDVIVAFRKAAA